MIVKVKHLFTIYKRYRLDLWGILKTTINLQVFIKKPKFIFKSDRIKNFVKLNYIKPFLLKCPKVNKITRQFMTSKKVDNILHFFYLNYLKKME
jgi:hypothetical protein